MYFNKYLYASNFEFVNAHDVCGDKSATNAICGGFSVTDFQPAAAQPRGTKKISYSLQRFAGDVYYLSFNGKGWEKNYAQVPLDFSALEGETGNFQLTLDDTFGLSLSDHEGKALLQSVPGAGFGVSGEAALFQFLREPDTQFYGMGEKMFGMELSKRSTKFWNTDVWGDFDSEVYVKGTPDPLYVSVPYLIIKRGNTYLGLLLDNPFATFISTDNKVVIANQKDADSQPANAITLGAEMGQPNLVIIPGPDLPALTRKLQRLVGLTPRPPAWALGYHQCRWGYESAADLHYIAAGMERHQIPCDGLWLDIEYMRGYRVFTFEEKNFPVPVKDLAEIQAGGRRVVPIIDPGVKAESGYAVYDSGKAADVFCRNPQGGHYIGLVWPGETVFPDFSLESARAWWAAQVRAFAETGITAAWLDMNDPSTGRSLCTEMLFNHGRDIHHTYHNQYALGMAIASREGFQAARPQERPFLLSRSGFTGSSRFCAIWTGDNFSNYHYLKGSISCTLNLALSGIPFNGPDVCGFGGDTNEALVRDWIKAGFLFPFLRNHSIRGSRAQEPWVFDAKTLEIYRHYVQLRYKLRPYLYNLFIRQAQEGEAILRPLFYDFTDSAELSLGKIGDQFMVGSGIMQAPFIEENQQEREIVLPQTRWYEAESGQWLEGGCRITRAKSAETTPLFLREGAVLPLARNSGADFSFKSNEVDFLLMLGAQGKAAEYSYIFDDGFSYGYESGKQSELQVSAAISGGKLAITTKLAQDGFGGCDCGFIIPERFAQVTINGKAAEQSEYRLNLAGKELTMHYVSAK